MNKKEADTQSETSDKPEVNEEAGATQEIQYSKGSGIRKLKADQQKIQMSLQALQKKTLSRSI